MRFFKNFSFCFFIFVFVLFLFLFFSVKSYADTITSDISSSVLRLHVIANSNSDFDQYLKYKVRDSLIDYMDSIAYNSNSKKDSISLVQMHLDEFKSIAQNTVKDYGVNYSVDVELGNFSFPTKSYGTISFPAGNYDALRVKIGNAEGRNWWCVMFPPLCFVDSTSANFSEDSNNVLKENLSEEDYQLVSSSNETSEFKFKIIEAFNSLAAKFSNN